MPLTVLTFSIIITLIKKIKKFITAKIKQFYLRVNIQTKFLLRCGLDHHFVADFGRQQFAMRHNQTTQYLDHHVVGHVLGPAVLSEETECLIGWSEDGHRI